MKPEQTLLWCFGDSNTYGFDPTVWYGGRFARPWPVLLGERTGCTVRNDGENGRRIPRGEEALRRFREESQGRASALLIVQLGVNDLLNGATAEETAKWMEALLTASAAPKKLLIAPPPLKRGTWVPTDALVAESMELTRRYRLLSERLGIPFADAGEWDIELTFDGVHFTERGHEHFARGAADAVRNLI